MKKRGLRAQKISADNHIRWPILAVVCIAVTGMFWFLFGLKHPDQHRNVARWTFPLWLYVSVTGVVTYILLRLAQG